MKRIFTLLASALLCTMVMGQQPTATIKKATVAPVIDGNVDDVWAEAEKVDITTVFGTEKPTVGDSWWKMLWNEDGIYLLTFIDDDVFVPAYMGANPGNSWMYDKLEIYFDCNYNKLDAVGPSVSGNGHYQIAPTPVEATINGGTGKTESRGEVWAFNASDAPHYYQEFFFPFTMLKDKEGVQVDVTEAIGFDVVINDNDILTDYRDRMNWASAGVNGEDWTNMDDAGLITLDGAVAPTLVETLAIADGAITADNGTFQIVPVISPSDATIKLLNYVVTGGTGRVSISATGLVTGIKDGTVTLRATATDGSMVESNEITITVSNQVVLSDEINMIKNSHFDKGTDGKESWTNSGNTTGVIDGEGFLSVECTPKVNIWDTMFGQAVKVADATTKYMVKFKAKATADMTVPMFFEDRTNGNNKTLTSSSPWRNADNWQVPVTTKEEWYSMDVTFSNFQPASAYEFNIQVGMVSGTFSIDDVQMYTEADFLSLTSAKTIASNQLSVYPNPVANELTVNMTAINAKVAIYNALGQKMMEKVSTGNIAKFNVSSLQKGIYFVKLNDGTTQKFIK